MDYCMKISTSTCFPRSSLITCKVHERAISSLIRSVSDAYGGAETYRGTTKHIPPLQARLLSGQLLVSRRPSINIAAAYFSMACPACSRRSLTALIRDAGLPLRVPHTYSRTYATIKRRKTTNPSDDFWIPFEPGPQPKPSASIATSFPELPTVRVPSTLNEPEAPSWFSRGSKSRAAPEVEDSIVLSGASKNMFEEDRHSVVDKDFFYDMSALRQTGKGFGFLASLLPKTASVLAQAPKKSYKSDSAKKNKLRRDKKASKVKSENEAKQEALKSKSAEVAYRVRLERKARQAAQAPESQSTRPARPSSRKETRLARFGAPRPDRPEYIEKFEVETPVKPRTPGLTSTAPQSTFSSTRFTKRDPTTEPTGPWAPNKRLSPDALEGVRTLHAQYPERFTPDVLAAEFSVTHEAIDRILRSKWKPDAEEQEERRERWERRGAKIWESMVERGEHAPKRWREMGIGAGRGGERRRGNGWKIRGGRKGGRLGRMDGGWRVLMVVVRGRMGGRGGLLSSRMWWLRGRCDAEN